MLNGIHGDSVAFDTALDVSKRFAKSPHILLGNGFSISYRRTFKYESLRSIAEFSNTVLGNDRLFTMLKTSDFEIVMSGLDDASSITQIYERSLKVSNNISKNMNNEIEKLRDVFCEAVLSVHPLNSRMVSDGDYRHCAQFLSHFNKFFTTNYDLLLYWALLNARDLNVGVKVRDGFRASKDGNLFYEPMDFGDNPSEDAVAVQWDSKGENVFFLHGALHLFEDSSGRVFKLRYGGKPILEQIKYSMSKGRKPIIVLESQANKYAKIRQNDYLEHCIEKLGNIRGSLFTFGFNFNKSDDHIVQRIIDAPIKFLAVGVFEDLHSDNNEDLYSQLLKILKYKNKHDPEFQMTWYRSDCVQPWPDEVVI